eukprot:CAMPEP_0197680554 /NCGR_PEP_ID=MMETSP1338-20131121/93516_1 /TAXON_ID=43686 ORGANISM="Pelagodinium beii, Strain RCC1491" /NCGR_SAMPLE_ID=MMETSP1338 /ASSEMBLY_ACC=CAM_ASM_000754 /LENGTH=37 /DNA_ID= /DNA_START= /DNA_END= /DNA_ORIENTATION=
MPAWRSRNPGTPIVRKPVGMPRMLKDFVFFPSGVMTA